MEIIKIVNLKCEGCARSIQEALRKEGFLNIDVDLLKCEVAFDGDKKEAVEILKNLGYPEVNSKEVGSFISKAKSFISCARGKIKK